MTRSRVRRDQDRRERERKEKMRSVTGRVAVLVEERILWPIQSRWWRIKLWAAEGKQTHLKERESRRLNSRRLEADRKVLAAEKYTSRLDHSDRDIYFCKLIKSSKNDVFRNILASRIIDDATLKSLAESDPSSNVRESAKAQRSRIRPGPLSDTVDPKMITVIVKTSPDPGVAIAGLKLLRDADLAWDIYQREMAYVETAFNALGVYKGDWEHRVNSNERAGLRKATIDLIKGDDRLCSIAAQDPSISAACKAFSMLRFPEECSNYLPNLIQSKKVKISISGVDIQRVRVKLTNCMNEDIRFFIPPGTIFLSSGVHQNMASVNTVGEKIPRNGSKEMMVRAVCINRHRPIPDKESGFTQMIAAKGPLLDFLRAVADDYVSEATIQAGTWAITDRLGKSDFSEGAGFDSKHIERAWEILRSIGYQPK